MRLKDDYTYYHALGDAVDYLYSCTAGEMISMDFDPNVIKLYHNSGMMVNQYAYSGDGPIAKIYAPCYHIIMTYRNPLNIAKLGTDYGEIINSHTDNSNISESGLIDIATNQTIPYQRRITHVAGETQHIDRGDRNRRNAAIRQARQALHTLQHMSYDNSGNSYRTTFIPCRIGYMFFPPYTGSDI